MLDRLSIENIAVIERADIEFHRGFHALTGETGAGKSILIDAIGAVLGERTRRDLIRSGSTTARVTALFSDFTPDTAAALEALGFPPDEDGNLLIVRTLSAEGKGNCTVNGMPATVALLRQLGALLVDLHGQHENQSLLNADRHREYLDRFGRLEPLVERYAAEYRRFCAIGRELQHTDLDEHEKARKLDLLRYQIDEIDEAHLNVGEEEALQARRALFHNAEKIAGQLAQAKARIMGDEETDGALSLLQQAVGALQTAARYADSAAALASSLQESLYGVQETADEVESLLESLEFDPRELDELDNRWEVLRRLESKYGATVEEILSFRDTAERELRAIELSDERLEQLRAAEKEQRAVVDALAAELSEERRRVGTRFAEAVQRELAFLAMPHVTLLADFRQIEPGSHGCDAVEFLLSANAGEEPRPLSKIASGGELSRIMLAIKSVLADIDPIDTMIFDEIDTGISGRAAGEVGIRLRQTADQRTEGHGRQVFCVTHLAQIAARAEHHYRIEKSVRDGRTYTEVLPLDTNAREEELARIIGGTDSPTNRQAAREMLAQR